MEYQYIVNPKTNRKCRINTPLGKRIIINYKKTMNGGGGVPEDCPARKFTECGIQWPTDTKKTRTRSGSLKLHPDKRPQNKVLATEEFKELSKYYTILLKTALLEI